MNQTVPTIFTCLFSTVLLQPDHYLRPLLESIICSFWSLNPVRVHTPPLVLLFLSERCMLSSCWCADSSRTQQGNLPAVDKYAPICVFHLNVCYHHVLIHWSTQVFPSADRPIVLYQVTASNTLLLPREPTTSNTHTEVPEQWQLSVCAQE